MNHELNTVRSCNTNRKYCWSHLNDKKVDSFSRVYNGSFFSLVIFSLEVSFTDVGALDWDNILSDWFWLLELSTDLPLVLLVELTVTALDLSVIIDWMAGAFFKALKKIAFLNRHQNLVEIEIGISCYINGICLYWKDQ